MKQYLKVSIAIHLIGISMFLLLEYLYNKPEDIKRIQIVLAPAGSYANQNNAISKTKPQENLVKQEKSQPADIIEPKNPKTIDDSVSEVLQALKTKTAKTFKAPKEGESKNIKQLIQKNNQVVSSIKKSNTSNLNTNIKNKSQEKNQKIENDKPLTKTSLDNLITKNILPLDSDIKKDNTYELNKKDKSIDNNPSIESKPNQEDSLLDKDNEHKSVLEENISSNTKMQKDINPNNQVFKKNTHLLSLLNKKEIPNINQSTVKNTKENDILKSNALTDGDKEALISQLSQCAITLVGLRDKTVTIKLNIKVTPEKNIENINILSISNNVSQKEVKSLTLKINQMFNRPDCSKLVLPFQGYAIWKDFNIELNLKSIFN